jgi:hypothetical protein
MRLEPPPQWTGSARAVFEVGIPLHVIAGEPDVGSLTRALPAFTMTRDMRRAILK